MNKLWFVEGRKLLKTRRCYAYCRDFGACEDLKHVSQSIMPKIVDPADFLYNGLYIQFNCYWHAKDASGSVCLKYFDAKAGCEKPLNIPHSNSLTKFPFKYLKINWHGLQALPNCPAALLIPKLLRHHGQTLEEIDIVEGPHWWDWLNGPKDLRQRKLWLPKLKVIKAKPLEVQAFTSVDVCRLVRAAPNLQDLLVCVTSKDLITGFAEPNRYSIIKSLCFQCRSKFDMRVYNNFALTEPELLCLVVKRSAYAYANMNDSDWRESSRDDSNCDFDGLNMGWCWNIFQRLLKSSRKSLEMIRLPVRVLSTQFGSAWQVFPNVTELLLEIPLKQQSEELYIHEVLRRFDFSEKFPNLTSVTLFEEIPKRPRRIRDNIFVNSVNHQPLQPLVYSTKIIRLALKNSVTDFGLAYSASVFAHVTELDLSMWGSDNPIPYRTIWREWPRLEVLSVREACWLRFVNYDAEFLGIARVEARGLQHKELKDVKNLHIAPTKPAITTMKSKSLIYFEFFLLYGRMGESSA